MRDAMVILCTACKLLVLLLVCWCCWLCGVRLKLGLRDATCRELSGAVCVHSNQRRPLHRAGQ